MYVPEPFKEERVDVLLDRIRRARLATLVTLTAEGVIASHVPLLLDSEPAPYGTLVGHLARPNPQAREAVGEALAIFLGPDAYITPSWYATKRETGKVVPTWDYVVVHAYGPIGFIDDAIQMREHVTKLTDHHEANRTAPWATTDAPEDFVRNLVKEIVGFRLTITRLEGSWKVSQNRPIEDRVGVAIGLEAEGAHDLAEVVRSKVAPEI